MLNKKVKNRTIFFLVFSASLVLGAIFSIKVLDDNVMYFLSPSEIKKKQNINFNKKIRIGGIVKIGSVLVDSNEVKFILTDLDSEIFVSYKGAVPNLFAEGKGAIAEGKLKDKNFFVARRILAKHDENYKPPDTGKNLKYNVK